DDVTKLFSEVDRFVAINEYPKISQIALSLFNQEYEEKYDINNRMLLSNTKSAYVKISEGCNNVCAYCAIPLIRGKFVSYKKEDIITQVKDLVKNGVYEINLISQDTTNYGIDLYKERCIVSLLEELVKIEGKFKIRLLYFYPELVTDELIMFIKNNDKVMPYFDIPIQHSENRVLKLMNRRGDKDFLLQLFKKIRKEIPHAVIRTTLIVGFPTETDAEVGELLHFIKEVKFDRLGAFVFSKEENTPAYEMEGHIDEKEGNNRLNAVYQVQEEIGIKQNELFIGTTQEVLTLGYDEESYLYYGRNYAFAPDDIDGYIFFGTLREVEIGEVVNVKILEASLDGLTGEMHE
ncbi:MAG: MiaB/RimO family radical SAM methylthiotransferase, partial [bacterium]